MTATGFPKPEKGGHKEPVFSEIKLHTWLSKSGALSEIMLGVTKFNDDKQTGHYKMGDVVKAYDEARELIENASAAYGKVVAAFRGTIKNDLASISSASDRVTAEVGKMQKAYLNCATVLTTENMKEAIANAERLASALKAISELQNHSITFAVLDKKTATSPPPPDADGG